ncbi:hypothetical protein NDU88_004484 [Pleurodeles waltl]|uniref:Uncharacterized protein n=1 Tax=Pleurodeles waltl TaxID=8319 RepID=A0AAV7NPG3_PLEWA|nr:hypothetical protein NDU88_004484 [Pleurodeles waltl]
MAWGQDFPYLKLLVLFDGGKKTTRLVVTATLTPWAVCQLTRVVSALVGAKIQEAELEGDEIQLISAKSDRDLEEAHMAVAVTKAAIYDISSQQAVDNFLGWRLECHEHSEQVGHLLAICSSQKEMQRETAEINDEQGRLVSDWAEMKEAFRDYYENLYKNESRK